MIKNNGSTVKAILIVLAILACVLYLTDVMCGTLALILGVVVVIFMQPLSSISVRFMPILIISPSK